MKIVIIAHVCYPILSPRAHRTTELAKEFARQGHDVTVYALLGNYDYTAYSQLTRITFKNLGKSKYGLVDNTGYINQNIFNRVIARCVGKYIVFPDIELIPMVKRAIKAEQTIDYLLTIADPHVIHYATSKSDLSKVKFWVADCGDPFMGNPFLKHPKYLEKFERAWCEKCDYIAVPLEEAKEAYYAEYREKMAVIPQGFDFSSVKLSEYIPNNVPTFAYAGVVYKDLRDPSKFLEYLSSLNMDFKFIVYTSSLTLFGKFKDQLFNKLEIRNRIPRDQLIYELSRTDFLINIVNNSGVQQPSKLIDYALTRRPILSISSDFTNTEKDSFNAFVERDYMKQYKLQNMSQYDIVNVVDEFLKLTNN